MTEFCDRCSRQISAGKEKRGSYGYTILCVPCHNRLNPNFDGVKEEIDRKRGISKYE